MSEWNAAHKCTAVHYGVLQITTAQLRCRKNYRRSLPCRQKRRK
nr:MAG TPA: hypothetical protein [Bacteriophage sp.]